MAMVVAVVVGDHNLIVVAAVEVVVHNSAVATIGAVGVVDYNLSVSVAVKEDYNLAVVEVAVVVVVHN